MSMPGNMKLQWEHYLMRQGNNFNVFWVDMLKEKERNILFILGLGFDPRMCYGLKAIIDAGGDGERDCVLIEYDEGDHSPSKKYVKQINDNRKRFNEIMKDRGNIYAKKLQMWSEDGRRIGSRRASEIIDTLALNKFTDIVIDISSMPRGIYFPIIAKMLYCLETSNEYSSLNLHVIISESTKLDETIQEVGIDKSATYMHGFSSDLELEATTGVPIIWIPVLGEGKEAQLIRIYDHIKPDEICPVFPSPSRNPRRADNLILEYRELLFDRLRVEPQNIVYASEQNPFEVYRQIYRTITHYNNALDVLGRCKVVVSAVSSKLLSIGALLAAHEAKRKGYMIGISHVESFGYRINNNIHDDRNFGELFSLWLLGECYGE